MLTSTFKELELRSQKVQAQTQEGAHPSNRGWHPMASDGMVKGQGTASAPSGRHTVHSTGAQSHQKDTRAGLDPPDYPEIPCVKGSAESGVKRRKRSSAVEAGHRIAHRGGQRSIQTQGTLPLGSDATRAHTTQTSHHAAEPIGTATEPSPPSVNGTGEGLRDQMKGWSMANPSTFCFANACTWAVMWASTHMANPHKVWGRLSEVAECAVKTAPKHVKIESTRFFHVYCSQWSTSACNHRHQDGAEFCADILHSLLGHRWGWYEARFHIQCRWRCLQRQIMTVSACKS